MSWRSRKGTSSPLPCPPCANPRCHQMHHGQVDAPVCHRSPEHPPQGAAAHGQHADQLQSRGTVWHQDQIVSYPLSCPVCCWGGGRAVWGCSQGRWALNPGCGLLHSSSSAITVLVHVCVTSSQLSPLIPVCLSVVLVLGSPPPL